MKKKVLVLGSGGMAGHVMTLGLRAEPEKYEVIDVARSENQIHPTIIMNVANFSELQKLVQKEQPDFIVNCVGLLNQYAEDHPDESVLLNSYLPHFLEKETKNTSTKVIHISSDCVFSGEKGDYSENDFKDGIGFYAQTKALGEILNQKDLTIRTSIIGPELKTNGIGLFQWYSKQSGTIYGYENAIWSGVTVIELMKAVKIAMSQDIKGLIHLVNDEKISKYDLLILFIKYFKNEEIQLKINTEFTSNKSVKNTRCDFNYKVPSYDQMLKEMKDWIVDNNNSIYQNTYSHLLY